MAYTGLLLRATQLLSLPAINGGLDIGNLSGRVCAFFVTLLGNLPPFSIEIVSIVTLDMPDQFSNLI